MFLCAFFEFLVEESEGGLESDGALFRGSSLTNPPFPTLLLLSTFTKLVELNMEPCRLSRQYLHQRETRLGLLARVFCTLIPTPVQRQEKIV